MFKYVKEKVHNIGGRYLIQTQLLAYFICFEIELFEQLNLKCLEILNYIVMDEISLELLVDLVVYG